MKKKTEKKLVGRINPFSRTWVAIKNTVRFNLVTLLLAMLVNMGLAIVVVIAAFLTIAGVFVVALSLPTFSDFLAQAASFLKVELPQLSVALVPAVLLVLVMPLLIVAMASFMGALLQKVLLESMRETKVRFSEVFRVALRKLPRLWLLGLIDIGVNLLIVAAIITLIMLIIGTLPTLDNTAFMFITALAGILALSFLLVILNLRWFLYSWFIVIDTDQKVLQALRSSKDHFVRAPGYTVALLAVSFAVGSVFSLVAGLFSYAGSTQVLAGLVSFIGGIFTLSILTMGYLDIKAAAKEQTHLRTKRGMLALAIVVFVIGVVISGSSQPKDESPMPVPFEALPSETPTEGDYGFPIDQS